MVAAETAGAAAGDGVHRRQGEQGAPGFVEVAGGDIDNLDQPLVERTIGLYRDAQPAVTDAAPAPASSLAIRRTVSAGMPVCGVENSG